MATTFGVSTNDVIRPYSPNCRYVEYPVHVSQTITVGMPLTIAGAGYENRVIAWDDQDTTGIVGIAMEAVTTTATHNAATDHVLVACADPNTLFQARIVADDASDFSDIGARFELEADGTYSGVYRIQTDGTTYEIVQLLEIRNPTTGNLCTAEGDTSPLGIFKFIPGSTIFQPLVLQ